MNPTNQSIEKQSLEEYFDRGFNPQVRDRIMVVVPFDDQDLKAGDFLIVKEKDDDGIAVNTDTDSWSLDLWIFRENFYKIERNNLIYFSGRDLEEIKDSFWDSDSDPISEENIPFNKGSEQQNGFKNQRCWIADLQQELTSPSIPYRVDYFQECEEDGSNSEEEGIMHTKVGYFWSLKEAKKHGRKKIVKSSTFVKRKKHGRIHTRI